MIRRPVSGTVTFGSPHFRYLPDRGFSGTDTFVYRVVDPAGGVSERAVARIVVGKAPAAPPPQGGQGPPPETGVLPDVGGPGAGLLVLGAALMLSGGGLLVWRRVLG